MPAQIVKVMKNQEASIYEYSKENAISELEKTKGRCNTSNREWKNETSVGR